MKYISTILFSILFAISSYAQVAIDPEVVMLESTGQDVDVLFTITNTDVDFTEMYWKFEKGENFPPTWDIILCDSRTCYAENIFQSSPNLPNNMDGNTSITLKITIKAKGFSGNTFGMLYMFSDSDFQNEIGSSIPPIVSVKDLNTNAPSIYPNPVSDHFFIENDEDIQTIQLYNNMGQLLSTINHSPGQSVSTVDYQRQLVYVFMKNAEGEILRTSKIHVGF